MNRIEGLDFLRGGAVLGMVLYHFLFVLFFYGVIDVNFGALWLMVFARVVQFTFIGLVGVGMALSWRRREGFYGRQFMRFLKIAGLAVVVTGATYLVIPDFYVRFGILHLVAVSSLLLMFLARFRWMVFLVGVLSLVLPFGVFDGQAVDYFPLFPWFTVVAFGFVFADLLVKLVSGWKGIGWVNFLGRKSLFVYMIHVPIIWVILLLFGII